MGKGEGDEDGIFNCVRYSKHSTEEVSIVVISGTPGFLCEELAFISECHLRVFVTLIFATQSLFFLSDSNPKKYLA